jgi:diguanylate cyclase (GGDEF)-like protein
MHGEEATDLRLRLETVVAECGEGPGRAGAMADLAWELRYEDAARAERLAEEALGLADPCREDGAGPGGDPSLLRIKARALAALGQVQADLGKHELAVGRLLAAYDLFEQLGEGAGLLQVRISLGRVYYYIADYPEAARHYRLALELAEGSGDRISVARATLNLGLCFLHGNDLAVAFDFLERALVDTRDLGAVPLVSIALDGLANAHLAMGNFAEALEHARNSVELSAANGIELNRTDALCTYADALVSMGRTEEALVQAERAESVARERRIARGQAEALRRRGDILRRLGRQAEAVEVLSRAVATADEVGVVQLRYRANHDLAMVFEEMGLWEKAFSHFQAFHELKEAAATFEADMKLRTLTALQRVESARRDAEYHRNRSEELEREVEERRRVQEELERLAITDPLTGLYNRRRFFEILDVEIGRSRRYPRPLSVLMIDVDHFKNVNDLLGHRAGDAALEAVARRIESGLRDSDTACRYGGEEFAVLMPETSLADAAVAAERLRRIVSDEPIFAGGNGFRVTVSIGLACRADGESAESVIERSDEALYRAKDLGRNRVESR